MKQRFNALISKDFLGVAYILLAALTVSLLPTTARIALDDGTGTATLLLSRGLVGIAIYTGLMLVFGKSFKLTRKAIFQTAPSGFAAAFFILGLYLAIQSMEISLAMVILYLYPIFVAAWNHFSGKSRLTVFRVFWSLLAFFGIALALLVTFDLSWTGVAWAFVAMLATVAVTLLHEKPAREMGALASNFLLTAWGCLFFTAGFLVFGNWQPPQTDFGWFGLIANSTIYCFTWLLFFAGANLIGTTRASMISVADLLFVAVIAWFIFGEWFSPVQWLGFFIVFFSLIALESPKGFWTKSFRKIRRGRNTPAP